jgi:hypothetical protein
MNRHMQCSKQRFYSITSSASASSLSEIVSPSAFAVLMLITTQIWPELAPCHNTQFITAKVSTALRLLTLIMPMPG